MKHVLQILEAGNWVSERDLLLEYLWYGESLGATQITAIVALLKDKDLMPKKS